MDKLTKLIEATENAARFDVDIFDADFLAYINSTEPSKLLPILRAFQELLEAVEDTCDASCSSSISCDCGASARRYGAAKTAREAIDNL